MTLEEYRSHSALNFSKMKWLLHSGQHFMAMKDREVEETIAMRMGSAVDEWILSGKVRPHAIKPAELDGKPWQGNRTACKQWVAARKAEGMTVYSQEEYDTQSAMQRALEASPDFQSLLEICPERQLPVFANYRGVELKILIDLAGHDRSGRRAFGDLKTSVSASPREFAKKAARMHYDLQQALYAAALGVAEFLEDEPAMFWAVVESTLAAPVSIFAVPRDAMGSGMRKLNLCIDRYKEGMETGQWNGYGRGFLQLEWPRWADDIEDSTNEAA